jgi:ribosomal protein L37AE/L43A
VTKFFGKILSSTVTFVITRIIGVTILAMAPVVSLISFLKTGEWMSYLKLISFWFWILLVVILVLLFIFRNIFTRVKVVSKLNNPNELIKIIRNPPGGWDNLGYEQYQGVLWNVRSPVNFYRRDFLNGSKIDIDKIDIQVPPHCPKCKVDLIQKHRLINGYLWKCVGCRFRKGSKLSFYESSKNVKKIVKGKLRNL